MPDFERFADKLRIDFAATEARKQFAIGYAAGKTRARYEVLAVVVALYFIVVLIGKLASA